MHPGQPDEAGAVSFDAPPDGPSSATTVCAPATTDHVAARPWWRARHVGPVALIVAVVVVANAAALAGLVDPNPLNLYAGLSDLTRAGYLPGLPSADPNTGITAQALGHLAALDWIHGHVPWWNPYEGLGAPLAGEMQSAAFFPPTLLLVFANGQVFFHLLLELLAGVATYALLIRLRLDRGVAVAGAVAYGLAGAFSWFSHAPVNPVPFLPVLLLGVELATDAAPRVRRWGWIIVALGVALSAVAGFPETAYIDGLFALAWATARVFELPRGGRRASIATLIGGVVTGLLLAAPILVAFLDYVRVGDVGGHSGAFGHVSLPVPALSQVFLPYIYGPIDGFTGADSTGILQTIWDNVGGYLTVSLLPLAAVGVAGAFTSSRHHDAASGHRPHRILRVVLAGWLVLAFGRTFGFGPLHVLVNLVPGMHDVAFYRYSQATWTMALAVLAAVGFDDLVRARVGRQTVVLAVALSLLVVVGSVVEARGLSAHLASALHHREWEWGSILWAVLLVLGIGLAAVFARGTTRRYLIASIVVVDSVAMFVVPQLSAPRSAVQYLGPVRYLAAHLGDARFVTVGPLPANYGSYFELASLNSNDVPQPTLYDVDVQRRLELSSTPTPVANQIDTVVRHLPQYESMGVRYLLTPGNVALTPTGARVLHRVYAGPSGEIFELAHPRSLYTASSGHCRVGPQSLDAVRVRCEQAGTLVRRELAMAGWTATVNGHAAPVGAHDAFETVRIPAGESTVLFAFTPPYADVSLAAFVVGLLICVAVIVVPSRRRRSSPAPDTAPSRSDP